MIQIMYLTLYSHKKKKPPRSLKIVDFMYIYVEYNIAVCVVLNTINRIMECQKE